MSKFGDLVELLKSGSQGFLSTISSEGEGYPFGSLVVYSMIPVSGWLLPCFVMSDLAEHAKNVKADSRASLLVSTPGASIFSPTRATWIGRAFRDDDLKADFVKLIPESEPILSMKDFGVYRLTFDKIRYIGGFGKIHWVAPEDVPELAV